MKKLFHIKGIVLPDPDSINFEEIKEKILGKFNISITFLFEGGIDIEYDDIKFEARDNPGDFSLYDIKNKARIFTILDNFDSIDFFGAGIYDEITPIYRISTINAYEV